VKRTLSIAAGLAVTAATLTYALWDADPRRVWQTLVSGRNWVILPFLLVLAVFYLTNAMRWTLMLRPFRRFSWSQVLPSMMIGFAGNNVLPLRIGELIRVYLFSKEFAIPKSGVLMTLVLERALDLLAILAIFGLGLALLPEAPSALRTGGLLAALMVAGVCAILIAFILFPSQLASLWNHLSSALPASIGDRGASYLEHFGKGLDSMRDPATASMLLAQSFGRWLLAPVLAWLCISGYGEPVPFAMAMVVIGVTAFAVSLPSAPGFVGPIQAAFVFALTPFGVSQETALAASILFLLGHWIPVTTIGAMFLASRHLSFVQLRREVDTEESFHG
jgi:uncharacterized protein (TIRG00374 family)